MISNKEKTYYILFLIFVLFEAWLINEIINSKDCIGDWIQGGCTIIAGALALWAGYLVYNAATWQIQIEEKKEVSRRVSYRLMMKGIVGQFVSQLKLLNYSYTNDGIMKGNVYYSPVCLEILYVPEEFENRNWENFSMLRTEEIQNFQILVDLINLNNFYALSTSVEHHHYNSNITPSLFSEKNMKEFEEMKNALALLKKLRNLNQICNMSVQDWYYNYKKSISILDVVYQSFEINLDVI